MKLTPFRRTLYLKIEPLARYAGVTLFRSVKDRNRSDKRLGVWMLRGREERFAGGNLHQSTTVIAMVDLPESLSPTSSIDPPLGTLKLTSCTAAT